MSTPAVEQPKPPVEQPKPMAKIPAKQTVLVTVICFVAWSIAVYDYILFGTLLPRIEESFGWTQSFALLVSTLASAAIFIVIIIFGPLVDRMGRRKGMMASVGGTAVAGLATAAVQGATSVVAVRGFTGSAWPSRTSTAPTSMRSSRRPSLRRSSAIRASSTPWCSPGGPWAPCSPPASSR